MNLFVGVEDGCKICSEKDLRESRGVTMVDKLPTTQSFEACGCLNVEHEKEGNTLNDNQPINGAEFLIQLKMGFLFDSVVL